jgi:glutathione S-transferase
MKLLWSSRSPFVRKVMAAAHEVGVAGRIATQRVVVGADKPNPDVMALNPLNKIPTLVLDDGTVLYDSRVIVEYLDTLHDGPKLIPMEEAARWSALRRQALGDGLMELSVLLLGERGRPKQAQSESHLAAFRLKIASALDRIEADTASEGIDPIAPPDIGHIAIGCALAHLDFRHAAEAWRTGRPRLSAWHSTFAERPCMRATQYADVH